VLKAETVIYTNVISVLQSDS